MAIKSKPGPSTRLVWILYSRNCCLVIPAGRSAIRVLISSRMEPMVSLTLTPSRSLRLTFESASTARMDPPLLSLSQRMIRAETVDFPVPPFPATAIVFISPSLAQNRGGMASAG
jgi:hypothetical protein